MTEQRRWFQFHLSTAIVVMFVAGGLLWANTAEKRYGEGWTERGWPLSFQFSHPVRGNFRRVMLGPFEPIRLLLNIVIAISVCGVVAFGMESYLRQQPWRRTVLMLLAIVAMLIPALIGLTAILEIFVGGSLRK